MSCSRSSTGRCTPAAGARGAMSCPMGVDWYRMQGIDVVDTDRGGKVTYHGPGQLVGYPIVRVDDVLAYVRLLERVLVAVLAEEGVVARARPEEGPEYTGGGSTTARSPRSGFTSPGV